MMSPEEAAAAIWLWSQCGEETAQGIECECETCGPVTHQPIPEDSAHCGCQQGYILKPPQHRMDLDGSLSLPMPPGGSVTLAIMLSGAFCLLILTAFCLTDPKQ